ncbi:MAG TPA: hypothetical protein VH475_17040 [Tepidisphaeraceae bacterium]|jgi:hypothetical protein
MKRLLRILLNAATVVSLVLCVATAVLWVRSRWTADVAGHWSRTGVPISDTLWSANGFISLRHWEPPANSRVQVRARGWFYGHGPAAQDDPSRFLYSRDSRRLLGVTYFDYTWMRPRGPFDGVRERALLVPYWLLLVVFGAPAVIRLLSRGHRRRAARVAAGLCPACGYDLRATPQRCPECGHEPGTRG